MIEKIFDVIASVFIHSPFIACMLVLGLWLFRCWWFRGVIVGKKKSYPRSVLEAFTPRLADMPHNPGDLLKLFEQGATLKLNSDDDDEWTIGEVYQVYSLLLARGRTVLIATGFFAFAGFALLIMKLAQPTQAVSLSNVSNIVGVLSCLALAILAILAAALAWSTVHKIPTKLLKDVKPHVVILYSW